MLAIVIGGGLLLFSTKKLYRCGRNGAGARRRRRNASAGVPKACSIESKASCCVNLGLLVGSQLRCTSTNEGPIKPTRTDRKRRAPVVDAPVRNGILAALLATEYKRLLPKLERVTLKRGEVVYRADQEIERVYFPEDAVVAMIDTTADRRTVEVGIIGHEGIVGINIFLGGAITPDRAIVQLPGATFSMTSKDLRKEVRFGSPLQRVLLDYTRTFLAVISQSVACSQHHGIEQRVARWLLTMNDYAGSREFLMSQQSMGAMLGVRRESITDAAGKFQAAALIAYCRGRMSILDKRGLEKRSCECYRFIRQQYESLYGEIPRLLSRV